VSKINDLYDDIMEIEELKEFLIDQGKRNTPEFEVAHMKSLDLMDEVCSEEPDCYGMVESLLELTRQHIANEGENWHLSPYPRRVLEIAADAMCDIFHARDDERTQDYEALAKRIARDRTDNATITATLMRFDGDWMRAAESIASRLNVSLNAAFKAVQMVDRVRA